MAKQKQAKLSECSLFYPIKLGDADMTFASKTYPQTNLTVLAFIVKNLTHILVR